MKFLHTADWQIGMRATQFGEKGERVRAARLESARRIIAAATAEKVDFLLLAGDVFEHNGVERLKIREVARILSSAPCPVYIIPGNRMVKIFKCAERSRYSMMDVEDEHNHMRAAFGLRYRFGQPGTPARE
jgi:hypothetical protein